MIYATSLTRNHVTYNNAYCFLKLYMDGPGYANAKTIIYSDQTLQTEIGAFYLGQYTFDELGANPMDTLHTLVINQFQQTNPDSTFTIVNPLPKPAEIMVAPEPPVLPDPLKGLEGL